MDGPMALAYFVIFPVGFGTKLEVNSFEFWGRSWW